MRHDVLLIIHILSNRPLCQGDGLSHDYKQGRAECGECGGVVVPVAGSARALGACPGLCYL